jgi:hypothetical protein
MDPRHSDRARLPRRGRVRGQLVQIDRDVSTWEHMQYQTNAVLTRHEAEPMIALRRWAERFHPTSAAPVIA